MRDWRALTPAERQKERDKFPNESSRSIEMNACAAAVAELLRREPAAQAIARKVTWGNYLINRPLDIVAHCKSLVKGGTGCDA